MAQILRRELLEVHIPEVRLDEFLFDAMKDHGNSVGLTNFTKGTRYTFSEILIVCKRLARGLQLRGFKKGDIVTLYGFNSEEHMICILASLHAGLTINTLNPAATAYELRHYLKEVQPRIVFTEQSLVGNVESAIDVIKLKPDVVLRQKSDKYKHLFDLCAHNDDVKYMRRDDFNIKDDVAGILFSSGTTGLPKGVMLTHYNFVANLVMLYEDLVNDKDPSVTIFPFYHIAGLILAFRYLHIGINHVFFENFNFELYITAVQTFKPTTVGVPPPIIVLLTKSPLVDEQDLASLKTCLIGAAPTTKETEDAFLKKFKNVNAIHQSIVQYIVLDML